MSIKIENTVTPSPEQWKTIILGARNAMNSWDRSDSEIKYYGGDCYQGVFKLGENDFNLLKKLAKAGPSHRKYLRMITVYVDITAPLYLWKELDTYQVGVTKNSCSTMHKVAHKVFTLEDFSTEHMNKYSVNITKDAIRQMNYNRELYLAEKDPERKKEAWWQMIQLMPVSYNQKRTVMLNYEVLTNIYETRRNHKLDEWHVFCDWIEKLPYSELITGATVNVED